MKYENIIFLLWREFFSWKKNSHTNLESTIFTFLAHCGLPRRPRHYYCVSQYPTQKKRKNGANIFDYDVTKTLMNRCVSRCVRRSLRLSTFINASSNLQTINIFTIWQFFFRRAMWVGTVLITTYLSSLQIPKENKSWVVFTSKKNLPPCYFFFYWICLQEFHGGSPTLEVQKKFRRRLEFPWLMGVMGQIVGQISNTEYDVL